MKELNNDNIFKGCVLESLLFLLRQSRKNVNQSAQIVNLMLAVNEAKFPVVSTKAYEDFYHSKNDKLYGLYEEQNEQIKAQTADLKKIDDIFRLGRKDTTNKKLKRGV